MLSKCKQYFFNFCLVLCWSTTLSLLICGFNMNIGEKFKWYDHFCTWGVSTCVPLKWCVCVCCCMNAPIHTSILQRSLFLFPAMPKGGRESRGGSQEDRMGWRWGAGPAPVLVSMVTLSYPSRIHVSGEGDDGCGEVAKDWMEEGRQNKYKRLRNYCQSQEHKSRLERLKGHIKIRNER